MQSSFARSRGFRQRGTKGLGEGHQFAETPEWLWRAMESVYGKFDFDPCPHNPKFDGLAVPWKRLNYCNPPYADIRPWLAKAIEEASRGKGTVFLIPFRPTAGYFQNLILPHARDMRILGENVAFRGYDQKMPVRLVVFIIGKPKKEPSQRNDAQKTIPLWVLPMPKEQEQRTVRALAQQLEERRGKPYQARYPKRPPRDGLDVLGAAQGRLQDWVDAAEKRESITDFMLMPNLDSRPFINQVLLNRKLAGAAFPSPHLIIGNWKHQSPFPSMVVFAPSLPSTRGMLAFPKQTYVWTPSQAQYESKK